MMNLKIVLCKSTLLGPVSGADEIMLNYAVHLRQAGYDARVVLLYSPAEGDQYHRRLFPAQWDPKLGIHVT